MSFIPVMLYFQSKRQGWKYKMIGLWYKDYIPEAYAQEIIGSSVISHFSDWRRYISMTTCEKCIIQLIREWINERFSSVAIYIQLPKLP